MVRSFGLIGVLAGLGIFAQPARAELPRSMYTVESVAVDVTNPLPVRAREIAIANAHVLAFQRLMHRFIPEPEVARISLPNAAELDRLAAAIEVVDEKSAGGRYLGRITIVFRPDEVKKRLKASGLPYSLTQGRPALVIAANDNGLDPAALRHAIDNLPRDSWLQPVMGPIGENEADLAAALGGDLPTLRAMAQRAGAVTASIVKLVPDPVVLGDAKSGGGFTVNVQVYGLSGDGPIPVMVARGGLQSVHITPEPTDGGDGIWARAAAAVADRVNEPWKRETAQDSSVQINVDARASFRTLAEWLTIREALVNAQAVVKMDLAELTTTSAALNLTIAGSPEKLSYALAQRDIRLQVDGPLWRFSRMGAR